MLTDTLKVSRAAQHGSPKTHFTIFPEYSIPGPDGIAFVETALRASGWPTGTIVIGGTDALSKPDFVTLAAGTGTHLDTTHNALAGIGQNQWINCAVIWVKAEDGTVDRWLQPKLCPAGPERNVQFQDMFQAAQYLLLEDRSPMAGNTTFARLFALIGSLRRMAKRLGGGC
jgi:hypothetical protein